MQDVSRLTRRDSHITLATVDEHLQVAGSETFKKFQKFVTKQLLDSIPC